MDNLASHNLTKIPAVPDTRKAPHVITTTEVMGWFQNVDENLLKDFVGLLNLHIVVQQVSRRSSLPSPRAVIAAAYDLRRVLDQMEAVLGGKFWNLTGAPRGKMKRLRTVLADLGDFLRPAPKTRKHVVWHEHAPWYAAAIAGILEQAGYRAPSLVNGRGPVAAIGAKAVARVWRVTISPRTFAGVVRSLRDSANQRVESTSAGRSLPKSL